MKEQSTCRVAALLSSGPLRGSLMGGGKEHEGMKAGALIRAEPERS